MIEWIPNKSINHELVQRLLQKCQETKQFTNGGPNIKLLEEFIIEKFEIDASKSVIVVANASLGIQILTHAISVFNNKELQWATQSFTFPPSNQGTLKTSIILDIDLEGGLNLEEVNEEIEGIIVTNIFGNIVDIDKYIDYCQRNNKYLIFDNAATHYTFYKSKNCLNYGDGCIISFHHTKPFGFGEGGAIIVDSKYEDIIRKLINFGISIYQDKYYSPEANNCKMSDVSAVYILQYLYDNFDIVIKKHRELYEYFKTKINELKLNITLYPSFHDKNKISVSCLCILCEDVVLSTRIEEKLLENSIFCRKYYHPLKETKHTINVYNKILCISCHKDMTFENINTIVNIIKKVCIQE
jgi:dTDP-4-amino-4,6-dideoxygalactose transaminase